MMEYFISNDAKKNIVQVDDDKHQQFWRNDIKLKGSIVPIMVSYVEAYSLILMLFKINRLTNTRFSQSGEIAKRLSQKLATSNLPYSSLPHSMAGGRDNEVE